ncbi:DUF2486 family protein [Paraburkholderia sp.]|uniref:DUF2486 family protein n=1 Tax=Paraburkholderia sp. TaxID=1926495 RepID=UPI0039E36B80
MSDPNDNSIPVLHEILVPGRAPQTREASGGGAAPAAQPAAPVAAPVPAPETELYPPHVADHTHAKKRLRPHHGVHVRHGHEDVHEDMEVSPGVFDRAEPTVPAEAGATVPPDLGHEGVHDAAREAASAQPRPDADVIAERLRARFAAFLTGEGRGLIEARCRDALQRHTSLLVGQITTEVAQTLEAEMTGWVREAVEEEIARRSGRA